MPIVQSAGQLASADTVRRLTSGGGGLGLYSQRATYAQILRSQPNVRTVISFIARNIAQLGVHLFERADDDDRRRNRSHPFAKAIRLPNPANRQLTTYRLIHRTLWDLGAYDVAFWALLPLDGLDRPAIVPLRPDRVTVTGHLWPTGYRYQGGAKTLELSPDQLVYFQGSQALDDPLWGVSPIETLRRVIAEDAAAGEYREQFWRSGARVSGIIERPANAPEWSDPARDRFRADWRAFEGQGPEAGGTPILEDGMTYKDAGTVDARSAQYVETRRLSREEAAALWHISPIWVGVTGSGEGFASVRERHKALYQDDLGPWVAMLEGDLTGQALPIFEPDPVALERLYVRVNIAEKLRGSTEDVAESINRLVGRPVLTPNEGRALLELNARPDGEGLTVPLNVAVGGQTIPGEAPPGLPPPAPATASVGAGLIGRKAVGPTGAQLEAVNAEHVAAHRQALERTFNRQAAGSAAELVAAAGVPSLAVVFDDDRWNAELAADLMGLALDQAAAVGAVVADALAFDGFDADTLVPFLDESTRIAAANINGATRRSIGDALATADPAGEVAALFAVAVSARAAQIAQTRVTGTTGFVSRSVAAQSGRTRKVWNVANPRTSRHPQLDGESVALGVPFSNGLLHPGDPAGGADETAGCTCWLRFE